MPAIAAVDVYPSSAVIIAPARFANSIYSGSKSRTTRILPSVIDSVESA